MSDGDSRRFVLLRHEMPEGSDRPSHDDLMLERDSDLFTLELLEPLSSGVVASARELPPHRKHYLDYEGAISSNRGSVRRIDRGALTIERWSDDRMEAKLAGESLVGRLTLDRQSSVGDAPPLWRVTFRADVLS